MVQDDDGGVFLGSGIAFPFRFGGDGRVTTSAYEAHVRESLLTVIRTRAGERVMRPEFGASLDDRLMVPMSPAAEALIRHEVEAAVRRFEPRVDIERPIQVRARPREGVLEVDLTYRVRRTDTVFNLVFPFNLERGSA